MECVWCRAELGGLMVATREHLIPRARGGTSHQENIAPACAPCNGRRKTTALQAYVRVMRNRGKDPDIALLCGKLKALSERKDAPKRVRQSAERQLKALKGI